MRVSSKPGYTLLEMLIAITIFSTLLIIVLATFSRSAGSSVQINVVREKSSVARSVMDQISNEFRFIKRGETITQEVFYGGETVGDFIGFAFSKRAGQGRLLFVLQFPGEETLVRKEYIIERLIDSGFGDNSPFSARFLVREQRGCILQGSGNEKILNCPVDPLLPTSILPGKFLLNIVDVDYSPVWNSTFDGLNINNPHRLTGYLSINLVIKPLENQKEACSKLPQGACFRVSTTLNSGVL